MQMQRCLAYRLAQSQLCVCVPHFAPWQRSVHYFRSCKISSCSVSRRSYCCSTADKWHANTSLDSKVRLLSRQISLAAAVALLQLQVLSGVRPAVGLVDISISDEGNVPSQLSAAGESTAPRLSSLLNAAGSNRKQVEKCTRRCVPTCIRGGEGAPGLGPISMRKEIVVFKNGFRSRQYCLSECTQVCSLMNSKEAASMPGQQEQLQQQQQQQQQQHSAQQHLAAAAAVSSQ